MNVLDSELVALTLTAAGYCQVSARREADVVIFNTCSVRQHAEDKIYSALGRLKNVKDHYPHKVFAVIGCMAQKDGELIFRRAPHVDLVVGPGRLPLLPELIERAMCGEGPILEVSPDRILSGHGAAKLGFAAFNPDRSQSSQESEPSAHQALVRIMYGCDNFCTYCIVPSVRGPEQSRSPAEIEAEVRQLAHRAKREGVCLEVTLIGQTVNSYRAYEDGKEVDLADLLHLLHDVEGLDRLKFVTNSPRYMSDRLLAAAASLPKVSPYFHVPAQSGSDAVLARMKRGYTSGQYRDMLARIYAAVPDAAVTSDFIVGFCGETEEDFQATVQLVRDAQFKNSFIFKYSTRPGTKAAELFADDVEYKVKQRRNNELLAVQNEITERLNARLVGRTVDILVEGASKAGRRQESQANGCVQLGGRTACDRIVVFDGPPSAIGQIIPVEISQSIGLTLFGSIKQEK